MGKGEGRNETCTHHLSFQKMELALVPLSAHGNFYEGDCYVILSVSIPSPESFSPETIPGLTRTAGEGRKWGSWCLSQFFLSAMQSRPEV